MSGTRITDAEREAVLAGLAAGLPLPVVAEQQGMKYGRAYRIAMQAGAFDAQREEARLRHEQQEQKKRDDEARLPVLLTRYHRGELVDESDPSESFVNVLLAKPALDSGKPDQILDALDSLVAIRRQREKRQKAAP